MLVSFLWLCSVQPIVIRRLARFLPAFFSLAQKKNYSLGVGLHRGALQHKMAASEVCGEGRDASACGIELGNSIVNVVFRHRGFC